MAELYANSNKQSLVKHLFAVGSVASLLSARLVTNKTLSDAIFVAGCLHDIGKVDPVFQQVLNKQSKKNFNFESYPTHNELSLLLYSLLNDSNYKAINEFNKKLIKHVLYWHHAKPCRKDEFTKLKCIYKNVKQELDSLLAKAMLLINELSSFKKIEGLQHSQFELIKVDEPLPEYKQYEPGKDASDYTTDINLNARNSFARACVVTADRLVSTLSSDSLDAMVANNDFDKMVDLALEGKSELGNAIQDCLDGFNTNFPNSERNIAQNEISRKLAHSSGVVVLSGAAGCGKTKVSLEWAKLTGAKKIIWVCPRVQVCEGLFLDLTSKEYLPNTRIEICTGSLKFVHENGVKRDTVEGEEFAGDIVLTTVDQVVGSIITHRNVTSLIDFMFSHVVFDEYHEYVNMDVFNLLFAELISCKAMQDSAKVLLVSATPHYLYLKDILDIDESSIHCLDSFNQCQYQIACESFKESDRSNNPLFTAQLDNSIVISNTATTAQKSFICNQDIENAILFHSKFTNKDQIYLFEAVFNSFKQNGTREFSILRSGPIVQAALNITCGNMVSELTSPDNTLQRLGRLNRFGEMTSISRYTIAVPESILISKKSYCADFLRRLNLLESAKAWHSFLQKNKIFDQNITLKQLYSLYYSFHHDTQGKKALSEDLFSALKQSAKLIADRILEPVKFKANNRQKRKISKNSLRGSSRFVQLAICEASASQRKHLDQYACSVDNTMTYPLEYLCCDNRANSVLDFMARKHSNIMQAKGQKTYASKYVTILKNMSVDENYPIYTSYTQQDLNLLGHNNNPCPGAIYYIITQKQAVGAMTNKNLEDIYK